MLQFAACRAHKMTIQQKWVFIDQAKCLMGAYVNERSDVLNYFLLRYRL